MEEIKLEVSLLDQNSKDYISNEMRKWNRLTTKGNIDGVSLIDIDFIEDTSYLDDIIKRLKEIIDDEPYVYTPPISNYPDRKYIPPSDEEFYEMLK